jgi:hypothetical protein
VERTLRDEELCKFHSSLNVIRTAKQRKVSSTAHVSRTRLIKIGYAESLNGTWLMRA